MSIQSLPVAGLAKRAPQSRSDNVQPPKQHRLRRGQQYLANARVKVMLIKGKKPRVQSEATNECVLD
eukprot:11081099-Heterocapsa_arctica.AAC.1